MQKFPWLRFTLGRSKSLIFSRDDDADDDECSHQILSSFVVFLFSML